MCLWSKTKEIKVPKNKPLVAWKIVTQSAEGYHLPYYPELQQLVFDKPMKARQTMVKVDDCTGQTYLTGFHVYATRDAARKRMQTQIGVRVLRVLVWGDVTVGQHHCYASSMGYSAQYMLVPKPRKEGGA